MSTAPRSAHTVDWMTPQPERVKAGSLELARYLEMDPREALRLMEEEVQDKGITVARAWDAVDPRTPAEVEAFYRETDAYLVDLLVDHSRRAREGYRAAALEVLRREAERLGGRLPRILDFGGGIGQDSLAFASAGFPVTYVDLPGRTSAFARWRFQDQDLPVEVASDAQALQEEFDVLFNYDVLEHVVDPVGMLQDFHGLLRPGGLLLVAQSFGLVGDDYPEHLPQHEHLDNIFARWVLPWVGFRMKEKVGPWDRLHVARKTSRPMGASVALSRPVTRVVSRLQKGVVAVRDGRRRGSGTGFLTGLAMALAVAVGLVGLSLAAPLEGQVGPYLPVDGRAHALAERLRAAGPLEGLSALLHPYRTDRVRALASQADTSGLSAVEAEWLLELRALLEEIPSPLVGDAWIAADLLLAGRGGQGEALDPWVGQSGSGLEGRGLVRVTGSVGPAALVAQGGYGPLPQTDRPGFWDPSADVLLPELYLAATGPWAEISVGRLPWSFGPAGGEGLLLRAGPQPLPGLVWSVGGDRLRLRQMVAPLDDLGDVSRFMALHRLEVRPTLDLEFALTEMVVWGGVGRDLEFHLVNPAANLFFAQLNREGDNASAKYALDMVWRPTPRVELLATYLLDDITGAPDYPHRQGFIVGGAWTGFLPGLSAEARLSTASALLYQVDGLAERFTYQGLGLATNRSDFARWDVMAHWDPLPWLRVTPVLGEMRQGPRDLRTPRPQRGSPELPAFLSAPWYTSLRAGVGGEAHLPQGIRVRWDLSHLSTGQPVGGRPPDPHLLLLEAQEPAERPEAPPSGFRGWVEVGFSRTVSWP
ncbi:MAG: methyltransferase domain-containing protein [Gemmatimonadota bacterium]